MTLFVFDPPEAKLPRGAAELRRQVREFIDEEGAAGAVLGRPAAWLHARDAEFSRRLAQRGWIGMWLPPEYGGNGDGWLKRYVVLEELVVAGAPVAAHWLADRQSGPSILKHGNEEQRRRYLPAIAEGRCFFSIGMSEKDAGSDLAAVQTRAVRTGDGWRITGTKMWTGGAHVNDYAIVLARTDPDAEDRHHGLSQFIVDLKAPGVHTKPIRFLTGEHRFNEFHMDGVRGGPDMLLGEEGSGWQQVTAELAFERSGPERVLATTPLLVALVGELSAHPVSAEQQRRLGQLVARLVALRHMSLGVAATLESGGSTEMQAALVKDLGTRFQRELVNTAREILPVMPRADATIGSFAEVLSYAIRYSPTYTLGGGANEILRGVVIKGLENARAGGGRAPWDTDLLPGVADVATRAALVRDAGYHGAPGPFAETLLVAQPLLAEIGLAVPAGPVAVALDTAARLKVRFANPGAASVVVSGSLPDVGWARAVQQILVVARGPRGPVALLVDRAQCVLHEGTNLAGEPRDGLVLLDVEVSVERIRPLTERMVEQARAGSALAKACLIAGAVQRCVELTVDHTATRHQFGRPLSRFQAVRQEEAQLIGEAAVVCSAVACAVNAMAAGRDADFVIACAKAQASASVGEITRIAHQLHGAVGFTERSPLHQSTLRLWAWREEDGAEHEWARAVGRRVLAAGARNFWQLITATTEDG
ncbi:acyl-CoA dehydrogenase family protein [Mycobacterium szulgai]|uniref:acyl-CoA dehydrogenase family protein n=1 Tax=Mycobacterium szulgai TaxID=1787 RepID=UPI00111C27DB